MTQSGAVALGAAVALLSVFGGLHQLRQALQRPLLAPEDFSLAFAYLFPMGAAVWGTAWLTDTSFMGFAAPWTGLTAAHFLVAGFGALTVSSWLARTISGRRARQLMSVLLVVHPLAFSLVAAGLSGYPSSDKAGAVLYLLVFIAQLILFLFSSHIRGPGPVRAGMSLALAIPVLTMLPALGWAWDRPYWGINDMVRWHGLANALGHVGLGLVMLAILRPPRRCGALVAPLSRLRFSRDVRLGLGNHAPSKGRGLSDSLAAYRHADFDTGSLSADIVAFYENTDDFELDLEGRWHGPFVLAGLVWSRIIAPALGQLGLPSPGQSVTDAALSSRIVDIDDSEDGRRNVRGWIRQWKRTGAVLYVAAYSEHDRAGVRYMNIAFPLPGGLNMTSILYLAHAPGGALSLTSRHHENTGGDQGVYIVSRGCPLRLPPPVPITGETLPHRKQSTLAGARMVKIQCPNQSARTRKS